MKNISFFCHDLILDKYAEEEIPLSVDASNLLNDSDFMQTIEQDSKTYAFPDRKNGTIAVNFVSLIDLDKESRQKYMDSLENVMASAPEEVSFDLFVLLNFIKNENTKFMRTYEVTT